MRRLAACFVATLLFGGGWLLLYGGVATGDPSGTPSDSPPTSAPPSEEPSDEPTEFTCNPKQAITAYLEGQGFADDEFIMGETKVDWSLVSGSAEYSFSDEPLRGLHAFEEFISADTAASTAALDLIGDPSEMTLVPVQFQIPITYKGNWYWKDGEAVKGGSKTAPAGDTWRISVITDGCEVSGGGSVRLICGNVGFDRLSPARNE